MLVDLVVLVHKLVYRSTLLRGVAVKKLRCDLLLWIAEDIIGLV